MFNLVLAPTKLQSNNKNNKNNNNNNNNNNKQQQKDWVIYNWTENVSRLIFLFLFLLCLMYHFVIVATTQLHSNMCLMYHFVVVATTQLYSNNNNNKNNQHKLLNFQ